MKKTNYYLGEMSDRLASLSHTLRICMFVLPLLLLATHVNAQSLPVITDPACNTPLVGQGIVVNNISSGLVSLLGSTNNMGNVVDDDLRTYTTITPLLSVDVLGTPLVSVRDLKQSYDAGLRAGFTINTKNGLVGGLLNILLNGTLTDLVNGLVSNLTDNFSIRTYLNGQVQETVNNYSLTVLAASADGLQQISFVTNEPFDEIELVQTNILSSGLLNSLDVYYAFVEPAAGCDSDCMEPIITGSSIFNPSIDTEKTGITGGVGDSMEDEENIINSSITDYAVINQGWILEGDATVAVQAGATIPAHSLIGFVIADNILLSVLSSGVTLNTYWASAPDVILETATPANVSLLGLSLRSNEQVLSFVTTKDCDELSVTFKGGIGLGDIHVYYAFAYFDSDGDGIFDCMDNCNNTVNSDGSLGACDTDCSLNAGMDITLCSDATEYDFAALGLSDVTWSILDKPAGSAAVIDPAGAVTGMNKTGTYTIQVCRNGVQNCCDEVNITLRGTLINTACNTPIIGSDAQVFDPSGGGCLLCLFEGLDGNVQNIVDEDLNNFIQPTGLISVLDANPLIGVKNTAQIYPAGTRTGFVVGTEDRGLLDVDLLSDLQIKTYLDGELQETSIAGISLLAADVIIGGSSKQRVGFVTEKPFDAVVLQQNGVINLSLLNGLRIYYAFHEPEEGCDNGSQSSNLASSDCSQMLLATNGFEASIDYLRTGLSEQLVSVGGAIGSIGNIIDGDPDSYATIDLGVLAAGATASLAVKSTQSISDSYHAGFLISSDGATLLNLSALAGLQMTVYYTDGTSQDFPIDGGLVNLNLLDDDSGKAYISFPVTNSFNEIQLTVGGLVNALSTYHVYGAFILQDSNGDGIPDCMDKDCLVRDDGPPTEVINLTDSESTIKVYTSEDYIMVSSSEKITGLTLFDLSGKIQYQVRNSGKYLEQINAQHLQGVFVLKVETTGKTESYKIIL